MGDRDLAEFGEEIRVDRERVPIYPSSLFVGMLVRIECYSSCIFPIRGVEVELQGLENVFGAPSEESRGRRAWGLLRGSMESMRGLVVRLEERGGGAGPILEVLLGEEIVVIDEIRMESFPFSSPAGTWRVFEMKRDDESSELV